MKTLPIARRRGMALVLVLSLLVLITGIVVGFLVRAGGERTASANYYASASARQLADTAVNLVQAQINEATTLGSGTYAWVSQPGAVRVYDNTGSLKRIFRLYSASSMVTAGADPSVLQSDLPPVDWSQSHALWTDLNAPVTVSSGTTNYSVYPVLDPRDPANPGTVAAPVVTSTMPGFSLSGTVPGATTRQPVPMPVRWLYVLQDGKISVPTASGSGAVTVPDASSANPIVGRIAFWTDDECAKVNINTAAGSFSSRNGSLLPAPWDTPRFKIWEERLLFSEDQPVKGEFQRYPGHPATTDLYGVLHALDVATTGYPVVISNYASSPQPMPSSSPSAFSKMLPYYADDNTSQGGASLTTKTATGSINGGVSKKDRLYTSLGELLYDPLRNAMLTGSGADGSTVNPRQQLESGKFFLTAHSRGPEVTLFGTPRVGMWPVSSQTGSNYRTSYDRLAAFCSTTGTGTNPLIYYIQRQNSRSATEDYDQIFRNQEIYKYLLRLGSKEIPGFGGNFASKYSVSNEWDQILTEMIDYIRCTNLYDHSVSSTNASFVRYTSTPTGLSGGKGQVVPLKIVEGGVTTHGLGRLPTISEIGIQIICTADGNGPVYQTPVTPSGFAKKVSPVYGSAESAAYVSNLPEEQFLRTSAGTIVDISGATVTAATSSSGTAFPSNPTLATDYGGTLAALSQGQKRLQAMLLFEFSAPMMGFDPMDMSFSGASIFGINVTGINGVSIAGQNPFPDRTPTASTGAAQNGNGTMMAMTPRFNAIQSTGGLLGFRYLLNNYNNSTGQNQRYNSWSGLTPFSAMGPYRYVSNPFTVSASGTASTTSLGGGFNTALRVPQTSSTTTYQTFTVTFPSTPIPVPDLPQNGLAGNNFTGSAFITNLPSDWWGFDKRIAWAKYYPTNGNVTSTPILGPGCVIRSDTAPTGTWSYNLTASIPVVTATAQPALSDVVRTMVARDGDYRVVAGLENVNVSNAATSPFVTGPNYGDSTRKLGNVFKDNFSALTTAGVDNLGKLVTSATYALQFVPKVPSDMVSKKQTTWDWDSGLPLEPDGAYANKPDEGNIFFDSSSTTVNRPYYNRESQTSGTALSLSSYFTANRIINSPVMFGSLPTGVTENISWRTLLFRPQQNRPYDPNGPKDHLLLDLFTMPVVEPYAISEPFSTAGKINLNYQIVPFTYIKRSTGVRAVLGSELIARVPKNAAALSGDNNPYYKGEPSLSAATTSNAIQSKVSRLPIDLDQTLLQCESKFSSWDLYKSPSEICDIYLVPQGYTWSDASTFDAIWYGDDFAMVGDNVRERPYSDIYPRLTTKSNTYTVHFKVQALKNPTSARQDTWTEATGSVTAEYQGSTTVERYLDPSNVSIPDYATSSSADSLDNYYQWRTVANQAFTP